MRKLFGIIRIAHKSLRVWDEREGPEGTHGEFRIGIKLTFIARRSRGRYINISHIKRDRKIISAVVQESRRVVYERYGP